MDLVEGELDAQRARQNDLQREIDALRQLVTDQQAIQAQAQQAQQMQQAAQAQVQQAAQAAPLPPDGAVGSMVNAQVLSNIKQFKGEPAKFKAWIKDVEGHVQAVGGGDKERIAIASQSAGGVIADFLFRFQNDHDVAAGPLTWDVVRTELSARFGDVVDAGHAMSKLRSMSQKVSESVTVFGERILDVAQDAFPNEDLANPLIGRQLVDIFIDGLIEDPVAKKLMRENPADLPAAVILAQGETRLYVKWAQRKRVGKFSNTPADQGHEPMEIGAMGNNSGKVRLCYRCNKEGHIARNCGRKPQVGPCYNCQRMGHLRKDCRATSIQPQHHLNQLWGPSAPPK